MRQVTLVLIQKDTQLLLGMKKRGFGEGKFNGFGGKPELNESLDECAVRETKEESGLSITDLNKVAIIDFIFPKKSDWNQQVHVYKTSSFSGELIETEEMKSEWFNFEDIPFDSMWDDDKYWLPLVLENKLFRAEFFFDDEGIVIEKEITEVTQL